MATFKPVILSGGKHIKNDGTSNIKIRIYHNKEIQYIATKHYINPTYLDKSGNISSAAPSSDLLTYEVNECMQRLREVYLRIGSRSQYMTCAELKKEMEVSLNQKGDIIDFVAFCRKVITNTHKEKTAQWYQEALNVLIWYYKREKIDVLAITSKQLNAMAAKLSSEGRSGDPLEPGAISNYLRGIRALYNKAKLEYNNEDYNIIKIPGDPFKKVTIPQYRRKRKNISVEMIKRIRNYESHKVRTNMARDVFMMMFYLMGMNINDLYKLRGEKRGRINYFRSKTNTDKGYDQIPMSIKIEPELQLLINRYSEGSFLSYFRSNYANLNSFMRAVNKGLDDICHNLELDDKVTTNWARHSWASIARNVGGVAKADVDFCLGHVNNDYKMADIYIDVDYGIFDRTNRIVLDILQKKFQKNSENVVELKNHLYICSHKGRRAE